MADPCGALASVGRGAARGRPALEQDGLALKRIDHVGGEPAQEFGILPLVDGPYDRAGHPTAGICCKCKTSTCGQFGLKGGEEKGKRVCSEFGCM